MQSSDSRRNVLAAWRGVDLTSQLVARADNAKPAAQVLPRVLKTLRMDQRRDETEIVKVWNELIDPEVVEHARPKGLHKGTLFVAVDSSVWLNEIVRYRRREILERLQHSFGKERIMRISFSAG